MSCDSTNYPDFCSQLDYVRGQVVTNFSLDSQDSNLMDALDELGRLATWNHDENEGGYNSTVANADLFDVQNNYSLGTSYAAACERMYELSHNNRSQNPSTPRPNRPL